MRSQATESGGVPKRAFSEGVWAHWGLLVSTFALGGVLILASWSNYHGARDATYALHLGEARIFEREIMGALHGNDELSEPRSLATILDSLLSQQSGEGLRYLALLDADGTVSASAGTPSGAPGVSSAGPGDEPGPAMTTVGSRVRMSYVRPWLPRSPQRPASSGELPRPRVASDRSRPATASERPAQAMPGPEPPPPEPEDGPRRERRHGGIVFEFEPLIAIHLMDRAGQLLAFGLAAAVLMMVVAAVSWGLSRRYERAMRRLEHQRRLSLLGEMSAVLAHEIRNPLASLKGHAQLLAERLPAESNDRGKAERVVREASRLEALTTDLLDFVRIGPLDRQPTDPAALMRQAVEEVDAEGFELDLARAPERWRVDGPRLHQALTNLLRNARQSSPLGARRPVASMSVAGRRLVITIRDFGSGLPSGKEDRLFDPFFTTRASGTGLGLAVARRIVELHQGELSAANHPEGGAMFQVLLPGE